MAGSGVTLYSTTSAGNKTVIGTIDWREDTYMPSQINDNVGQIMADVRALANAIGTGYVEIGDGEGTYTATYVSATSFRFDGVDVTAYYRAGMRVRVVAPTPGTLSGTITSSTFSTHTTLVVAWDSGLLSNEAITSVSLGIGSGGGAGGQPSYRNILGRNGGFEVWQRGAGGSASIAFAANTAGYTADGWYYTCGAAQASTVAQQGGIFSGGSRYSAKVQRNAGQTGVATPIIECPLDTDEVVLMRNSIVTLSLTLTAGANWSPASGNISVRLYTGTGSPAKRALGAYANDATPISVVQPITTTATRYSFTSSAVVPSSVQVASVLLTWTPVGTAGADDSFSIDDVQLEVGAVATPFERRPFEQELAACQRHYFKTFPYEIAPAQNAAYDASALNFTQAVAASTAQGGNAMRFPVYMRIFPTITTYNPAAASAEIRNITGSTNWSGITTSAHNASAFVSATSPAGSAAGSRAAVHLVADAGI